MASASLPPFKAPRLHRDTNSEEFRTPPGPTGPGPLEAYKIPPVVPVLGGCAVEMIVARKWGIEARFSRF